MERKSKNVMLVLALVASIDAQGQNLVPNGSFEDYTQCPEFFGYAQYATGWMNLHTGSADYFNRCQENLVVGVPFNTCGYQEPAEGDAYMGLATTFPGLDWYREIVGIELTEPLQSGVPVCLSFKMALGGFGSWDAGSAIFTSKGVGVRFFNGFPAEWANYLYPNAAALSMDLVPMDTSIWYLVSGDYTPDSNYTHLAIGNFFHDSLSSITNMDTVGIGTWGVSYAFIDDVRVSYASQLCMSTAINASNGFRGVRVFPNPFVDRITVAISDPARELLWWELRDAFGHQVEMGSIAAGTGALDIVPNNIAQGAYLLRLFNFDGVYAQLRLVSVSP